MDNSVEKQEQETVDKKVESTNLEGQKSKRRRLSSAVAVPASTPSGEAALPDDQERVSPATVVEMKESKKSEEASQLSDVTTAVTTESKKSEEASQLSDVTTAVTTESKKSEEASQLSDVTTAVTTTTTTATAEVDDPETEKLDSGFIDESGNPVFIHQDKDDGRWKCPLKNCPREITGYSYDWMLKIHLEHYHDFLKVPEQSLTETT